MSIGVIATAAAGTWVAAANGGNDNAKGVATLIGARVLDQRRALWLGHLATFAGAMAALFVSTGLIRTFQGSGLLAPDLVGTSGVLGVVAGAAAITICLATGLSMAALSLLKSGGRSGRWNV